jgi:hypothetical protein
MECRSGASAADVGDIFAVLAAIESFEKLRAITVPMREATML